LEAFLVSVVEAFRGASRFLDQRPPSTTVAMRAIGLSLRLFVDVRRPIASWAHPAKDDPSKNRCIGGETRCGTFRWYGSPPFATKKSKAQAMVALIRPKILRPHLGRRDRSHE